jgi:hypothetical protein
MCRFAPRACATPLSQTFLLASGANVHNCGCQARWHACVFARSATHCSALHSALVAIVIFQKICRGLYLLTSSIVCMNLRTQLAVLCRLRKSPACAAGADRADGGGHRQPAACRCGNSHDPLHHKDSQLFCARLLSDAGCMMGIHGAGEGRLPRSRPKGAHPRWVGGPWGSPSGVSRRRSAHGIAPSGDFATARDTLGLGRLAHRLWSAASCALALKCSAIAACCAPARRARRSPGRGRRACAIKQAAHQSADSHG